MHHLNLVVSLVLFVSAVPAGAISRLSKPSMNSLCSMMLLQARRDETSAALDRLRAHRLWDLGAGTTNARLVRNFSVDQGLSTSQKKALADHIRGIEIWTQSTFQDQTGEPKLAGTVLTGSDQIEAYYRGLESMEGLIRTNLARDAQHIFRMKKRVLEANAGGALMFLAMVSDVLIRMAGMDSMIPWYASGALLATIDPVSASLPKFRGDSASERFETNLHTYLNYDASKQKGHWLFSSIEYRVQWFAIDAAWSGEPNFTDAAFREFEYLETFGPIMRGLDHLQNKFKHGTEGAIRNRNLKYGWVYLDHLLRFNEELQAPELIVTVRTIANNPRNRAPITSEQPQFSWANGIAQPIAIPTK